MVHDVRGVIAKGTMNRGTSETDDPQLIDDDDDVGRVFDQSADWGNATPQAIARIRERGRQTVQDVALARRARRTG
jgi:hypothetical protein